MDTLMILLATLVVAGQDEAEVRRRKIVDEFKLQGDEILELPSGEYFFTEFKVLGQAELKVAGTATIYLGGKSEISGKAKVNVEGDPCHLRILSAGDSVHFAGQSTAKLSLYGMLADVQASGKAEVHGAVTAKSAHVGGDAKVHYHSCECENAIGISMKTDDSEKQFEVKPSGSKGRGEKQYP